MILIAQAVRLLPCNSIAATGRTNQCLTTTIAKRGRINSHNIAGCIVKNSNLCYNIYYKCEPGFIGSFASRAEIAIDGHHTIMVVQVSGEGMLDIAITSNQDEKPFYQLCLHFERQACRRSSLP